MKQAIQVLDIALPEEQVEQTVLQVKDLQKELLVLRLSFGKLKAAIIRAVEPVAAVLVPVITNGVYAATRLANTLGQVISGLLGVQVAQKKVEKTVVSAGKAAKRSLAGFDQLNRLQGSAGGAVTTRKVAVELPDNISEKAQQIVSRVQAILAPLQSIDLKPLQWSFGTLEIQLRQFAQVGAEALNGLWHQALVPLVTWVAEKLAPTLLNFGADALGFLRVCLGDAAAGFLEMLEDMRPLTDFVGRVVVTTFEQLGQLFANTRISAQAEGTALGDLFRTVGDAAALLWERMGPVLEQLRSLFAQTFQSVGKTVFDIMNYVLDAVSGAVTAVAGLLTGDWAKAWKGISQVCKNAVNAVIGVLNVLLSALTGALNGVFKVLNKISIKVPDWVMGFGGKTFGFNLKELKTPQIPYLAKGAVLPANKPFLAMVGDQKHGTNVEAPLATIQEAVAMTMEDMAQSNLAGHQATVDVLQQILEAVLGIRIGDAELYRAVERYREKRGVMLGTGW